MNKSEKLSAYERLRKLVIDYRTTHTIEETAKVFHISCRTMNRWINQYIGNGSLSCKERGGNTHCRVTKAGEEFLLAKLQETNDLTLEELRQKYRDEFNILISSSTVNYHLRQLNLTVKKKVSLTPNRKNNESLTGGKPLHGI